MVTGKGKEKAGLLQEVKGGEWKRKRLKKGLRE